MLRTYPLKEADLVVSFLARDQGKLRGVAKRARRPKSPFGAGLERLSQVRLSYFQRENRELVNLDSCDLLVSQFRLLSDYGAAVALDFFAEDYRSVTAAGRAKRPIFPSAGGGAGTSAVGGGSRRSVARGDLLQPVGGTAIRPSAGVECLSRLRQRAGRQAPRASGPFLCAGRTGLLCGECRRTAGAGSWELSAESRVVAEEMLRKPVAQMGQAGWSRETCADLRRFLTQQIEQHIERKLLTPPVLEAG